MRPVSSVFADTGADATPLPTSAIWLPTPDTSRFGNRLLGKPVTENPVFQDLKRACLHPQVPGGSLAGVERELKLRCFRWCTFWLESFSYGQEFRELNRIRLCCGVRINLANQSNGRSVSHGAFLASCSCILGAFGSSIWGYCFGPVRTPVSDNPVYQAVATVGR
jgi:hypothetical protein